MYSKQNFDKLLSKQLKAAIKGKQVWDTFYEKYWPGDRTALILLPHVNCIENYYALIYIDTLIFRRNGEFENAIIITQDEKVLKSAKLISDKIIAVEKMSQSDICYLLEFYSLTIFDPRFIVASLSEPRGRNGFRLEGLNGLSIAEIFLMGVYKIFPFAEPYVPRIDSKDKDVISFLNSPKNVQRSCPLTRPASDEDIELDPNRSGVISDLEQLYNNNIAAGSEYYENIKVKYGEDVSIVICPHKGTGDMYFIGRLLHSYLENNNINNYVFLFRGGAECNVGKLFGVKQFEIISTEDTISLMNMRLFVGVDNVDIIHAHHYPFTPQIEITGFLEGYRNITFNDMFYHYTFMLNNNCDISEPIFSSNPHYINKIFKKYSLKPNKTVVIAPYATSTPTLPMAQWEELVRKLVNDGYTVVTNTIDFETQPPIKGSTGLSFSYGDAKLFLEHAGYFVGIRSGLCDIISSLKCKKLILYSYESIGSMWISADGKVLRYFGLRNNNLCNENIFELEYTQDIIEKLPNTIYEYIIADNKKGNDIINSYNADFKLIVDGDVSTIPYAFDGFKIATSLVFNGLFAPYAAVTIQSIIDHATPSSKYDICLLVQDVPDMVQKQIKYMTKGHPNVSIRFIDISKRMKKYVLYTERGYNSIIYARLMLPEILSNYDSIIYMDSDVVLNKDIADLYRVDLGNNYLGGVRDTGMLGWYYTIGHPERDYMQKVLRLRHPEKYVNSGVLIFNNKIFHLDYPTDFIFNYISSRQWHWMDQDIFMTLFEDRIKILPQGWNVIDTRRDDLAVAKATGNVELVKSMIEAKADPYIIHYIGCGFLDILNSPDYAYIYWEHAKKSPFYEIVYYRCVEHTLRVHANLGAHIPTFNSDNIVRAEVCDEESIKKLIYQRTSCRHIFKSIFILPFVNLFFPNGSKRREKLRSWLRMRKEKKRAKH